MAQKKLTEDMNFIQKAPLEITQFDGDLNIIAKLDDEPNDVGGMTSEQLKAEFDKAGNTIKTYLNETLIPELLASDATEADRAAAEQGRVDAESARVTAEQDRVIAEQARVDENNGTVALARKEVENAAAQVTQAKSWAEGGTGEREDEDKNNAKYWAEQAAGSIVGVASFNGRNQIVMPMAGDYTADMVGAVPAAEKGAASGVASLDESGKVPEAQLPQLGMTPEILVKVKTGSAVVCSMGSETMTATSENGEARFKVKDYGSYTVSATLSGESTGETVVDVEQVKLYTVELHYTQIYGVRWDGTSPTKWERTDASELFSDPVPAVSNGSGSSPFDNLMPWSGMHKESRSAGVMVAIPKYWLKVQPYGNGGLWVQIADGPVDGFQVDPGHADRGDGKGERDVIYVGRYHCASDWRSKGGEQPKTSITRPNSNSGIHGLGSNIWLWDWAAMWSVKFLYLVEFADWNSQKVIGKGCGNNSGTEAMGYTDGMSYHTGTSQGSRDTYGCGTQYRWIEGLWDNAYDWVGGCYYNGNGLNIIMNPANYSDSGGGTLAGPVTAGYSSKFAVASNGWAITPTEGSGNENTHMSE